MGKAVDEVRAEYEKKLAAAEREDAFCEALERENIPAARFVHVYPLYGSIASLYYGDEYSQKPVSLEDALSIVRALPPIDVTIIRDGSRSFRPTKYIATIPEEKKTAWESEESVCSVWFDIDWSTIGGNYHTPHLHAKWYSHIEDIGIVYVSVAVGSPNLIGHVEPKIQKYSGGFQYSNTKFSIGEKMRQIYTADGEYVAQFANYILWGRGSEQTPNKITVYFDYVTDATKPAFVGEAIIASLAK